MKNGDDRGLFNRRFKQMLFKFALLTLHFYSFGFFPQIKTALESDCLRHHFSLSSHRLTVNLNLVAIVLVVLLHLYPINKKGKKLLLPSPKQRDVLLFWLAAAFYLLKVVEWLELLLAEITCVLQPVYEMNHVRLLLSLEKRRVQAGYFEVFLV